VEMDMLLILRELDQIGSSLSNMKVVPFLEWRWKEMLNTTTSPKFPTQHLK
jgi:hypothetical protein